MSLKFGANRALLIEELVGRGEFGQPVQREVDLHERGPVVAAGDSRDQLCGNVFGRDQLGCSGELADDVTASLALIRSGLAPLA